MTNDLANKIATKQVETKAAPTIKDLVRSQQPAIEAQLAGALNSGAFVRAAISEINKSDDLLQATSASVLGSIMLAAQLKLEIGPALGHFYLTPRKEKGVQICLPIVGYQGLIELAYRSGRVGKIETFLVREGDKFDYGANSERGRFFDWNPADYDENRAWTGAVVTAQILGGGVVWAYMPKEKILERRPSHWKYTPWATNEEEMARKTLVREVSPYLPKSTDFGLAVQVTRDVEERGAKVESIAGVHDLVVTQNEGETFVVPPADLDPADPNYVEPTPA
jgi:recombination protein RecT